MGAVKFNHKNFSSKKNDKVYISISLINKFVKSILWAEKKLACYIVKIVTARRRECFWK